MKINTKYFGTVEIDDRDIVCFEHGIPGFPDERGFVFLPIEDTVFHIMQSTQTPSLALTTSSPFTFFKQYEIDIPDLALEQLQIQNENEVMVLVTLQIQTPFSKSTANLVAPIVINTEKRLGKQVILEKTTYTTKHMIPVEEG